MKTYPEVSGVVLIQARYVRMRQEGQSHSMADLLAHKLPPGTSGTDRAFLQGETNGSQFANCPDIGNYYRYLAQQAGVSTHGKVYKGSLANQPGDPEAWVSGTGDAKKLLEKRGWGCSGSVNVTRGMDRSQPKVGLADDIVQREVASVIKKNPGTKLDVGEVAAKVRERHTPHWKKKKGIVTDG